MSNKNLNQSLSFKDGELDAQRYANKLLLTYLPKNSYRNENPPEQEDLEPMPHNKTYQRIAELESELARARRFIDSLNQSRAYRLTMKILRMLGRAK